MLELEDALNRILSKIPAAVAESVPLDQAHHRVALRPIVSPINLPPFDNSSMDGYAVLASDIAGATPDHPIQLKLAGRVAAGESSTAQLKAGSAVRVFTGSPLPAGADAVVMQEDTRTDPRWAGMVSVLDQAKPWENVRFRGEDVKSGAEVLPVGERISAGRMALLSALGISTVFVGRQPRVALLATGSELREAGQSLAPGQIYESNRNALASLILDAGGISKRFPIVADEPEATRAALEQAFASSDIVITCGGVSVGEFDFVKSAFQDLGGNLEFWRVAIKPGRPFVFGELRGKFLFGLPGNPVSAMVTFLLLARPALLRWQGCSQLSTEASRGRLAEPVTNEGGRRHFVRVRLDSGGLVRVSGLQASHALSSLAEANALLELLPGTHLAADTEVTVLKFQ